MEDGAVVRRARREESMKSTRPATRSRALEPLETRRLLAIVVNTTADEIAANSTTSLREAINQANASAGDDVITFDPNVFDSGGDTHVIILTLGDLTFSGAAGTKVDIQGPGTAVLSVSGNVSNRVFNNN